MAKNTFELPTKVSGYYGCLKLGRMVPVEACRVHSQGMVKEANCSEFVLENCKGCGDWRVADAPAAPQGKKRKRLSPPVDVMMGRKKLSL